MALTNLTIAIGLPVDCPSYSSLISSLGLVENQFPVWFVPRGYFALKLLSTVGLVCFLPVVWALSLCQVLTVLQT